MKKNPRLKGYVSRNFPSIFMLQFQFLAKIHMKNLFLLCAIICILGTSVKAQDVIRIKECNNQSIKQQVDSLKQLYAKDGFVVMKEASITMESEYEMPVIVPLQQGTWYQFVFIGEPTSRLYEVRMFDWNEKQVVYQKKMWGDIDGNIISYSYIPRFTEFHMMKPVQINKKKKGDLCGYVMLLKKTQPNQPAVTSK
jgi:hypothetical protein